MKKILLALSLTFLIVSCQDKSSKKTDKNLSVTNKKNIQISEKTIISEANFNTQDSLFFANVRDLCISEKGDIYLLDSGNKFILKFDSNGKLKKKFELKLGRGPGEFINPNSIFVDSSEFIYITDRDAKKLIILDDQGNFHSDVILKMMPAQVSAFDPNNVFLVGFRFTYKDENIIVNYSRVDGELKETASFGERIPTEKGMLVDMSGYADFITVSNDQIILNRFFPYHFDIYDSNLNIVKEVAQTKKEFVLPYRDEGLVRMDAVGREILILKDFNLVRYLVKETNYFDLYDKKWNYENTLDEDRLNLEAEGKFFSAIPESNEFIVLYQKDTITIKRYTVEL